MFKLVLEKAEEPDITLPTSTGSSKKQDSSRKTFISALLTMLKPLTVWITKNWKILEEMRIPDHLTCLLRNLYASQEATVTTGHGTDWFQIGKEVKKALGTQSCWTLCNCMDCGPPGFSVHGILQARILEWVAIPFSRESSWPRNWTWVSCIAGRFFTVWATREAQIENPLARLPSKH